MGLSFHKYIAIFYSDFYKFFTLAMDGCMASKNIMRIGCNNFLLRWPLHHKLVCIHYPCKPIINEALTFVSSQLPSLCVCYKMENNSKEHVEGKCIQVKFCTRETLIVAISLPIFKKKKNAHLFLFMYHHCSLYSIYLHWKLFISGYFCMNLYGTEVLF